MLRTGDGGDVQESQQVADVLHIMELLAEPHGGALHRQEVFGLGDEDAELGKLEVIAEFAVRAEESLHGIVQPRVGDLSPCGDASGRLADDGGGLEERVNVASGGAALKNEAHDSAADDVEPTTWRRRSSQALHSGKPESLQVATLDEAPRAF